MNIKMFVMKYGRSKWNYIFHMKITFFIWIALLSFGYKLLKSRMFTKMLKVFLVV